jgi:hypothetical protein
LASLRSAMIFRQLWSSAISWRSKALFRQRDRD